MNAHRSLDSDAVARGKEPVVRLVPVKPIEPGRRVPNRFAHLVPPGKDILEDGFWDPLPPEHLGLGDDDGHASL